VGTPTTLHPPGQCRATLVSFSGVDGAGKSTQIEQLEQHFRAGGQRVVRCWARGGYTPLFALAKKVMRRTARSRLPGPGHGPGRDRAMARAWVRRLWLTAAILDLILLWCFAVRWWRLTGRAVICDRYLADSKIDFRLNFPAEQVERWRLWHLLEKLAPTPEVAFIMLLPVEESLRRCRAKDEPFTDSPERFRERLAEYTALADRGAVVVLDAQRPVESLALEIRTAVDGSAASRLTAGAECRHAD